MRAYTEVMKGPAALAVPTENTNRRAVEMIVLWNDSAQLVRHYRPSEKNQVFTIGEEFDCDFAVPAELIGGRSRLTLMERIPGSRATIADNPADNQRREMQPGERCRIELGPFIFIVSDVADTAPFVAPFKLSVAGQRFIAASLVLHAIFLGIIFMIPPDGGGIYLNNSEKHMKFIQAMMNMREAKSVSTPEILKKTDELQAKAEPGMASRGPSGKAGKRNAPETTNRFGQIGPRDNKNITVARDQSKDMAREAGVLQFLNSPSMMTSPFGAENPMGADPENALGALLGDAIGINSGYNGIGVNGTGRGGPGNGDGTIGVGSIWGKLGNPWGNGKHGQGGPPADLKDRARPGFDGVRSGPVTTKGTLSPDLIRRVVQRHIAEVKFCYEKQLSSRPDLAGRVVVRFTIAGSGAVQGSAISESTLGNAIVEQCITNAVRRWSFPQPQDNGVVIVTYPFQLTNANN